MSAEFNVLASEKIFKPSKLHSEKVIKITNDVEALL